MSVYDNLEQWQRYLKRKIDKAIMQKHSLNDAPKSSEALGKEIKVALRLLRCIEKTRTDLEKINNNYLRSKRSWVECLKSKFNFYYCRWGVK